jgi:hypothetical protein
MKELILFDMLEQTKEMMEIILAVTNIVKSA